MLRTRLRQEGSPPQQCPADPALSTDFAPLTADSRPKILFVAHHFASVGLGGHAGRSRGGSDSIPAIVDTDLALLEFRYDCYDRWTANNRKAVRWVGAVGGGCGCLAAWLLTMQSGAGRRRASSHRMRRCAPPAGPQARSVRRRWPRAPPVPPPPLQVFSHGYVLEGDSDAVMQEKLTPKQSNDTISHHKVQGRRTSAAFCPSSCCRPLARPPARLPAHPPAHQPKQHHSLFALNFPLHRSDLSPLTPPAGYLAHLVDPAASWRAYYARFDGVQQVRFHDLAMQLQFLHRAFDAQAAAMRCRRPP